MASKKVLVGNSRISDFFHKKSPPQKVSPNRDEIMKKLEISPKKQAVQGTKKEVSPLQRESKKAKMDEDFFFIRAGHDMKKNNSNENKNRSPTSTKNTENIPRSPLKTLQENSSSFSDDLDELFNDFDGDLVKQFELQMNLNEPQQCEIVEVDKTPNTLILKLKSVKESVYAQCHVGGFWSHFEYDTGSVLYITAAKSPEGKWYVDNQVGCIVYEPNLLISCTSIVGSTFCKRRTVLQERYRGFDPSNKVMIIGVLVHTLLEGVLRGKIKDPLLIETMLKDLVHSTKIIRALYDSGISFSEIEPELAQFVPKIVDFVKCYIENDKNVQPQGNWVGSIHEIDDIEENLWCPQLGIKGKVDVSVQTSEGLMPLELKTGRATVSLEHRGQIILYIMMLNKLGYKIKSGLLLYLREGVLKDIPTTPKEERDLVILRNELVYYLNRPPKCEPEIGQMELPDPINHPSCTKCPYNLICTSYLRTGNYNYSLQNKHLQELQNNITAHLSESHLKYFTHWSTLLSIENTNRKGQKSIQEIYTVKPQERESNGKCIINVKAVSIGKETNGVFEHVFKNDRPELNFLSSGFVEHSYIVVSTDHRPAVASGFVTRIDSGSISITLDRDLDEKYRNMTFHLDMYDSNSFQTYNLSSLALLLENTPRAAHLREIIIDRVKPRFLTKLSSKVVKKGAEILKKLNIAQQRAVLKALAAQDYVLFNGMPGTGKTATIVALIQLLVELNKTVLLTSQTHSAIDNVCLRLQKCGVDFIRLGTQSRIHEDLKQKSEHFLCKDCKSPEELEQIYNNAKVIAITCLGSGHPLLSKRTMDVCIVDESTQVIQTSVIRPLYASKTFVLVGDPEQLPPVATNKKALEAGINESLFKKLMCPEATVSLNINYRMNRTITDLANALTYKGDLLIGNEIVENSTLCIPRRKFLDAAYRDHSWMLKALNTSLDDSVKVIDTGPVWKLPVPSRIIKSAMLSENSDSCSSIHEAFIVKTLISALTLGGVPNTNIGVIATYNSQVNLISRLISNVVQVSTVDQFQGQDRSVIIYSCSKSRDVSSKSCIQKHDLLEDKRRLCVAVTRAKHKLIIVGDVATVREYEPFSNLLKSMDNKNVIVLGSDFNWEDLLKMD